MTDRHKNGAGLKVISSDVWYGSGYCGVCGTTDVVPVAVRYWDCDDGWRVGVLCAECGKECSDRGPQDDDYAVKLAKQAEGRDVHTAIAEGMDMAAGLMEGDMDGLVSMLDDMGGLF